VALTATRGKGPPRFCGCLTELRKKGRGARKRAAAVGRADGHRGQVEKKEMSRDGEFWLCYVLGCEKEGREGERKKRKKPGADRPFERRVAKRRGETKLNTLIPLSRTSALKRKRVQGREKGKEKGEKSGPFLSVLPRGHRNRGGHKNRKIGRTLPLFQTSWVLRKTEGKKKGEGRSNLCICASIPLIGTKRRKSGEGS